MSEGPPENWEIAKLGEICQLINGDRGKNYPSKNKLSSEGIPFVNAGHLENSKITADGMNFISEERYNLLNSGKFQINDILFCIRGSLGKLALNTSLERGAIASSLIIARPDKNIVPKYALYYLEGPLANRMIKKFDNGTAQPNLSGVDFGRFEIPISPLIEQKRIVAKIEELFSELDKGIESLKTAREQLKVYRQAVLKHAFEGKLTADWREQNKDQLETADELLERIKQERETAYQLQLKKWKAAVKSWEQSGKEGKKPAKPNKPEEIVPLNENDISKLAPLPHGWAWLKVNDLCDVVRGGSPRPAGDPRYYDGDIPFLKVADITRTPSAYLDTYSYTIKKAGLQKTRKVSANTLLLSNSGATLGVPKICLIEVTFNDGIAAFLGLNENHLLYYYYFWTNKTKELRAINQGAAQPNLNTDLIKEVFIPICSPEEMVKVTREIERKLSVCDRISEEIENNLQKVDALRQSILKQAFSGKLVAQDPNDEPASVLLERIKAEKNGTQKKKRKVA